MEWQAGPSSINGSRAYWIQGRQGSHWSNVETLTDVQTAIDRLGRLVAGNRYDELRLVEARISAISGKAVYTELLIVRDGEVMDPTRADPVGPAFAAPAPAHPELPLWSEDTTQPGLFPDAQGNSPAPEELEWIAAPRRRPHSVVVPAPPIQPILRSVPQEVPTTEPEPETETEPLQLEELVQDLPPPQPAVDSDAPVEPTLPKTLPDFAEWMRSRPMSRAEVAESKSEAVQKTSTDDPPPAEVTETLAEPVTVPEAALPAETAEDAGVEEVAMADTASASPAPSLARDEAPAREWSVEEPLSWLNPQVERDREQTRPPRSLGTGDTRARYADFEAVHQNRPTELPSAAMKRKHGLGRGPVLAGVFVLAVATGIGIAALDPATSARLSAALFGELPLFGAESRLAAAIDANDPDAVRAAILSGADPNASLSGDAPALLLAARGDADQAFHALLEAGADPSRPVDTGRSVMHVMAAEGLTGGLAASLAAGTPIDLAGGTRGCVTPLTSAAAQGRSASAMLLAERGARLTPLPGCDVGPLDAARLHPELEERLKALQDERVLPPAEEPVAAAAPVSVEPAPAQPPFTIVERQAMLREPKRLGEFLAQAIDRRDQESVRFLMANRPVEMPLDTLGLFARDMWGTGYRMPVDYAVLAGNLDAARLLLGAGAVPSARIVHLAVDARSHPGLKGAAEMLLGNGADANALHDGLTPLMRAALKGDWDGAQLLLAYGADASIATAEGQTAADFAAEAGDTELQEMLTLRANERQYSDLMMGLSWFDTLASVNPPTEACETRQAGYLVCSLDRTIWLTDAIRVQGHFDLSAGNRLVAIEIHGAPIASEKAARDRFAAVAADIQAHLPEAHRAFSVETMPQDPNVPFLEAIRPEVAAASWYRYWSDDNKARPAFLHLSLIGVEAAKAAQWRLVVGNPFRSN